MIAKKEIIVELIIVKQNAELKIKQESIEKIEREISN